MKKSGLIALKVFVSLGILVYLFTRVVHINDLWANLREAKVTYFLAAVAVYFAVQTLSAYRWYLLLKPLNIESRFTRILGLFFLGMYFNFFLPSSIGGDFFKIYYLHKETGRLSASTASVFVDRDIGMGGLLLIALVAAAWSGTSVPPQNGVLLAPVFALIGLAFVAANLALFYRPTYNLLHRLLSVFRMKKADEKVERLFESVNSYRGKWGLAAIALLISLGVQVGCAVVNMLAAGAIGLHTQHGWIDYMVFIPAIGLIGMIPLSVNGAGWREASYILLFQSVGAEAHQAATLSLLWLGVMVVTSLPGGLIYIARGRQGKENVPPSNEGVGETRKIPAPIHQSREEEPVSTVGKQLGDDQVRSDSEMRTQKKFVTRLVAAVSLFATLLSTTGFAQEKPKPVEKDPTWKELRELDKKGRKPPSGPSFFIAPLEGSKAVFSVLLSDANGQTVSGSFTLQQLDVFEAVLAEAKAFALTDEKVGSGTPIITRLMDQHEWSFFVDVSKIGNQSRLYVSLITINGKLTTEAGEITRGSKKEPSGLLLKMLSQVHEAKASVAQH